VAERTGRTVEELLEGIGVSALVRWYAHIRLEQEEQAAFWKRVGGG